jgi:hypothetical protein
MTRPLLAAVLVLWLAGCGGGGPAGTSVFASIANGTDPSLARNSPAPQGPVTGNTNTVEALSIKPGAYTGTISGSAVATAGSFLLLETGEIWGVYGYPVGNTLSVTGFFYGVGSLGTDTITAASIKDFGTSPPLTGSTTATYSNGTLTGGATIGSRQISFIATGTNEWNYDTPASIADIQGVWSFTTAPQVLSTATIAADGTFAGVDRGCSYSGLVSPRPSGKNVFNIVTNFGPAPCLDANSSASGIGVTAVFGPLRQLVFVCVNSAQTRGYAFFATR